MRCSGIHRSLGTHISKVKSTVLDNWQPHMVARMDAIGNATGKLLYEHGVPSNYPRNFTDQHQLVSWITNKYANKKWYNESADPELGEGSDDENDYHQAPKQSSNTNNSNNRPQANGRGVQAPVSVHAGFHGASVRSQSAEPDLFAPAQSKSTDFADFTGFNGTTTSTTATPAFDAFGSGPTFSQSLPATPAPSNSNDLFGNTSALHSAAHTSAQEPDLFALPSAGAAHASPAPSSASAAPAPVDKSALMNLYRQTALGNQQAAQQQQQQMLALQQQAFLQQQMQFQQQLAQQNMWAPTNGANGANGAAQPFTNHFGTAASAFAFGAAPAQNTSAFGAAPYNSNNNAFAGFGAPQQQQQNAFASFGASPVPNGNPQYASPAANSLASIYAQSPPVGLTPTATAANSYSFN